MSLPVCREILALGHGVGSCPALKAFVALSWVWAGLIFGKANPESLAWFCP